MTRTMMKSKIHRATVTDSDLNYIGSITIDPDLLDAADIREYEQVAVVDINNGARFETYVILGVRGSGDMKLNGAAARLVHSGDLIIVISYATYTESELSGYAPRIVHVDGRNRVTENGRPKKFYPPWGAISRLASSRSPVTWTWKTVYTNTPPLKPIWETIDPALVPVFGGLE